MSKTLYFEGAGCVPRNDKVNYRNEMEIVKIFKSVEMKTAYNNGGYRERYAMENGRKTIIFINGHKCFKFSYSANVEYQDANGAIYDTIQKCWIN